MADTPSTDREAARAHLPVHRLVAAQVATACYLVVPFASVVTVALGGKGRGAAHVVAGLWLAKFSIAIAALLAARLKIAPVLSAVLGVVWFLNGWYAYSMADVAALGADAAREPGSAVRNWMLWSAWIVPLAGFCAYHGRAAFMHPWKTREVPRWAMRGLKGLVGGDRFASARIRLGLVIVMVPFFLAVTGRAPLGSPMMVPFRAVAICGVLILLTGLAPINREDRGDMV